MAINLYLLSVPTPTKKPTKKVIELAEFDLQLARVRRPNFEAALFAGDVHKAERYDKALMRNPLRLQRDAIPAYVFTADDLDGKAETESVSMSVRAWIVKNILPSGIIGKDEFGIVYVPES